MDIESTRMCLSTVVGKVSLTSLTKSRKYFKISHRIHCDNGVAHGHFGKAVRARGGHPQVWRIVLVQQDVEGLAGEIRQAVRLGEAVDVVHLVGLPQDGSELDSHLRFADHGDGPFRAGRTVGADELESAGRIHGKLLDVGNRVPEYHRALVTGYKGREDSENG